MSKEDQFFTVVLVKDGRMYPCEHQHETREEADACVEKSKGIAIVEWNKDRRPQFQLVWSSPELTKEKKARLPWS